MLTNRILPVKYNEPTNAYEARCTRCEQLVYQLAAESPALLFMKPPQVWPHKCLGPADEDEDD